MAYPIKIAEINSNQKFTFYESRLNEILLKDEIKDRSVVVVSVAGAFRKGKSFLLNFFLRYLYAQYRKKNVSNWIGDDNEPLTGFEWHGGSTRVTTGILMWSDVFTYDYENGEKIAIILMDTQGVFDNGSTVASCTKIFAMSTLLSSVQCFNLFNNIQEDDLQHLNLFAEYGRLALEDSTESPFQKLQFIVRDWNYPYEARYGSDGGKGILQRRLALTPELPDESRQLRVQIQSCFSEIECFLMAHPGQIVASSNEFRGRLSDVSREFKCGLRELIPMLLAPNNLVIKKINGQKISVQSFISLFRSYGMTFANNGLPEPQNIFQATASVNNENAVSDSVKYYKTCMAKNCGIVFKSDEDLRVVDATNRYLAMRFFELKRLLGSDDFRSTYRHRLNVKIDEVFQEFVERNEMKQKLAALGVAVTTATIAGIAGKFLPGLAGIWNIFSSKK